MLKFGRPVIYSSSQCLRQSRPSAIPTQHHSNTLLLPSLVLSSASKSAKLYTASRPSPAPRQQPRQREQRRAFLGSFASSTSPESFSASRKLPHPPSKVFAVVSDVDSYSAFLPYCISSKVTHRTPPPESLPTSADLRVGFAGMDETFTSKVRCSSGVLEADASENSIFEILKARWTVSDGSGIKGSSDIKLDIEYKFANPLYAALSQAVMPKVAGILIEAFEKRAVEVLSRPSKG